MNEIKSVWFRGQRKRRPRSLPVHRRGFFFALCHHGNQAVGHPGHTLLSAGMKMAQSKGVSSPGGLASPRMGVVRASMLTNPLLIKARVGQSRSPGLHVPGPHFTFGARSSQGEGGVAEVLSHWRVHESKQESPAPCRQLTRDFVALNRDAVRSGLVTSKQMKEYRARMGVAEQKPAPKVQKARTSQRPDVPDITFGVKTTRASSPLSHLLSHEYARRWRDDVIKGSRACEPRQRCFGDTRTTLVRRSTSLPHTQASHAVDTFRK
uniref:cilia- and flagella-associated protein 77 n=1 Tax=Doryrhamphus excisus TaxID=161450 RepID=UPI0025ADB70E|nr:cilia- and flagella-associated protein 77 [Doryrhamphus excisus]